MMLFRGKAEALPLHRWLTQRIFPWEAQLEEEDVYWASLAAMGEMLRHGVTAFADMYFFEEAVARGVLQSGMRALLSRGVTNGSEQARALAESEALLQLAQADQSGHLYAAVGPHAPYTVDDPLMAQLLDLAERYNVPVHTHLQETHEEVTASLKAFGERPVARLLRLGVFEHRVLAAHCVWLDDTDLQTLAHTNITVAHNPASNLKLGSGIAPTHAMRTTGVLLSVGTDGPASNNRLDVWSEIRLASLLEKGSSGMAESGEASFWISAATQTAYHALFGMKHRLEIGDPADCFLFEPTGWESLPQPVSLDALLHTFPSERVSDVFVAGEQVVQNGVVQSLDMEKIRAEVNQRAKRFE